MSLPHVGLREAQELLEPKHDKRKSGVDGMKFLPDGINCTPPATGKLCQVHLKPSVIPSFTITF